jgi:hypothetical protein
MPSCGCVRRADPGSRLFKIPDEVPLRSHAAKVALSLDEIAADLTVAVNTVKSHVRSVYIGRAVTSGRTTHETSAPHARPSRRAGRRRGAIC